MMRDKYSRIMDRFEQYYPYLYKQTVDWWPSGRSCVTVKLEDGLLMEFESMDNTIRRVQSTNCIKDIEVLRRDIGRNIQKMILTRGIPQTEIAEKCEITPAMLSRYIHGTSMPGIDKVHTLATVLGCRIIDIIGETYEEGE